ncbi:hypothetical protein FS837_005068 [Tulasnella sp. UAMH 9824]|nr:hypothetical protein FS837_005068 [Tulasnella sp. UAMH 9824]
MRSQHPDSIGLQVLTFQRTPSPAMQSATKSDLTPPPPLPIDVTPPIPPLQLDPSIAYPIQYPSSWTGDLTSPPLPIDLGLPIPPLDPSIPVAYPIFPGSSNSGFWAWIDLSFGYGSYGVM